MIDLRNGDCLELMKDISDESIDCILTDPPYLYLKNQKLDKMFDEDIFFNECKRVLKTNGMILLFGRGTSFYRWNTILSNLGFTFKEEIIWNKRLNSTLFNQISRVHESISISTKGKGVLNNVKFPYLKIKQYDLISIIQDIKRIKSAINNTKEFDSIIKYLETFKVERNLTKVTKYKVSTGEAKSGYRGTETLHQIHEGMKLKSIIEVQKELYKYKHPTQKPIELLKMLLPLITQKNNLVLDPFMGSGSTGVACINTGRDFIGIELDEGYFNIAQNRIKEAQSQGGLF